MTIIIRRKEMGPRSGKLADRLARLPADGAGELRVVDGARERERPDHRGDDHQRLPMRALLAPVRKLALDEADEILDATAHRASHIGVLARHLAARRRDGAAE